MVVVSGANSYAKEMAIRKRIANIFNKREDDFPSLRDYNDYLEEVEDMTFNLIEGIDVASIEAKIAQYQEENSEQIINSRARKAEELAAALAASKGVVPAHTDDSNGATTQNAQVGESISGQGQYAPAVAGMAFGQPRPTGMAPQPMPLGAGGYGYEDEETMKQRSARAGGWSLELSKRRAVEEAFGSMWI